MKLNCLSLSLLLFSSLARAAESDVEITSKPCTDQASAATVIHSAGTLLKAADQLYVLTSDAALYQSNNGFCHSIFMPGLAQVTPVRLVTADWTLGLALLKVSEAGNGSKALKFETVQETALQAGDSVQIKDQAGSILVTSSKRHSIPAIQRVIEVVDFQVSPIFIGAGVYSGKKQFLGIVSRQYLKVSPGKATSLQEWDRSPSHLEGQLVVIPVQAIHDWMTAVLAPGKEYLSEVRIDPEDQKQGINRIRAGKVLIEEISAAPRKSLLQKKDSENVGGDGSGVGGDGVGVGGDGVGIGGSRVAQNTVSILISLAPTSDHLESIMKNPSGPHWLANLSTDLAKNGGKVEVPFSVKRSLESNHLMRISFNSLSDFYKLANLPSFQPIFLRRGRKSEDLKAYAEVNRNLLRKMTNFDFKIKNPSIHALYRQVKLISLLLWSDQFTLVRLSDLDSIVDLSGDFEEAWNIIQQIEALTHVDSTLLDDFKKLRKQLSESGVTP